MRTFACLYIAVTFAFSANATILNRRATSAPVYECVGLIDNMETRLEALSISFAAYQERDESIAYTPADISKIEQDHEKLLNDSVDAQKVFENTRAKCCFISIPPAAEEDSMALFGALKRYSSAAINAFNTLNSKIDKFDKYGVPYNNVARTLSALSGPIKSFHECLVRGIPLTDMEAAQTSVTKAYNSFLEVTKTFEVIDVPGAEDPEDYQYGPHPHPEDP